MTQVIFCEAYRVFFSKPPRLVRANYADIRVLSIETAYNK